MIEWNCPCGNSYKFHGFKDETPQRTWVGLSESDRRLINFQWQDGNGTATEIIDLVEAKLKEKNT